MASILWARVLECHDPRRANATIVGPGSHMILLQFLYFFWCLPA